MGQRLFFALDIDQAARERIVEAADRLRLAPGRIKWTRPANLHVTMNFLGDVPDNRIAELSDLAATVVDQWDSPLGGLTFSVDQLIGFPADRRPTMIWAPVGRGNDLLASLHQTMNQALADNGWRSESRPFTGHITVARIKEGDLRGAVSQLPDVQLGLVTPAELTLYQSQLTRSGPIYSRLAGATLPKGR